MTGLTSALAVLVGLAAVLYLLNRVVAHRLAKLRSRLAPFDYVVFEAHPSHLADLEADLAAHRWRLAGSEPANSGGVLYRFEKASSHSTPLSEVLDFRKSMQRTANRKNDPHIPIKIKAHGMRHERNG